MSASDKYIAEVKKRLLGMYKELQTEETTLDDRLAPCYTNVGKCVDLLWEYRTTNPSFKRGKEGWFEKDLAGWSVLELIRDQVKPLMEASETDWGRYSVRVKSRGRMEELENMQTLLRRMKTLTA